MTIGKLVLNVAKLGGRAGTLHVDSQSYVDVMGELATLRRYTSEFPAHGGHDLVLQGPWGPVRLVADTSLAPGMHRWTDDVPVIAGPVVKCSYCGAPGQRVGTRCEYCQVAVSR